MGETGGAPERAADVSAASHPTAAHPVATTHRTLTPDAPASGAKDEQRASQPNLSVPAAVFPDPEQAARSAAKVAAQGSAGGVPQPGPSGLAPMSLLEVRRLKIELLAVNRKRAKIAISGDGDYHNIACAKRCDREREKIIAKLRAAGGA